MKHVTRALAVVLVMLAFGGPEVDAVEVIGGYHENKRWGYKVRAPKKWKRRTVKLDELWIADKFFPDYTMEAVNERNEVITYRPSLWVIGFPQERKRKREGESSRDLQVRNPYKSYKDFVKRESWASTHGGGWYYSREDQVEHRGYVVDVYEIKVEKLVNAPLRIVTWVYHCEGVDFAVQLRLLEGDYKAHANMIQACMKSFREMPRTEPFPQEADPREVTPDEELTIEEIDARRVAAVEKRIEREIDNLPKGWRSQKSKNFIVITQMEKKYNNYVLRFAESIRSYLEDHFKDLGPSKLPRGLIRVFSSSKEEHAYQQGTRGWWTDEVGEITMAYAADTHLLSEFSWLAARLTDQYFRIKNENLEWGMPGWIRTGIWSHIRWARPSKRKKMILKPTPSNVRSLAIMFAKNEQVPLRDLMTVATGETLGQHAQAASVVYWLMNKNSRGKAKRAVTKYLMSLEDIIREEEEKFERAEMARMNQEMREAAARAEEDAAKTQEELEAEEDEQYRQRRQNKNAHNDRLKAKGQAIRDRALQAAFGDLTEKDWGSLDKRWRKFAKP